MREECVSLTCPAGWAALPLLPDGMQSCSTLVQILDILLHCADALLPRTYAVLVNPVQSSSSSSHQTFTWGRRSVGTVTRSMPAAAEGVSLAVPTCLCGWHWMT
jgi:hypothetical protein